MKNLFLFFAALCFALPSVTFAQEQLLGPDGKPIPEHMRYFKEKYEEEYQAEFETVWQAVIKSIEDMNCQIMTKKSKPNDDGLFKGNIVTEHFVRAYGDTSINIIKKYSFGMPFIRGGVWDNFRIQYKIKLQEIEQGKVNLLLTTIVSGKESYVTSQVIFDEKVWKSNGILEKELLESIKKYIDNPPPSE